MRFFVGEAGRVGFCDGVASRFEQNTDRTVLQVAYDCGFDSLRTFNRNFKRIVGVPPSACRSGAEAEAGEEGVKIKKREKFAKDPRKLLHPAAFCGIVLSGGNVGADGGTAGLLIRFLFDGGIL